MRLRGTIATLNVGPIGLAEFLAALAPVLALRPIAALPRADGAATGDARIEAQTLSGLLPLRG